MNLDTFFVVLALFLWAEVCQWSISVGYHAYTKHRDRLALTCRTINYRMLTTACVMAFLVSMSIFMWQIYVYALASPRRFQCIVLGLLSHLSHIHFLAILGRCSELDQAEFPPVSRFISKNIVTKVFRQCP